MATFKVECVMLDNWVKHPNADTLSMTTLFGAFPVIFRTEDYNPPQKVYYIPIDATVPNTEEWAFLGGHNRIKAKKLRGIFSMGMLKPAPEDAILGQDYAEKLGITKYEPPIPVTMGGDSIRDPGFIPKYTEIENFRRYGSKISVGTPIYAFEKLHGANSRYLHDGERLWVGSHGCIKDPDGDNVWSKLARDYNLAEKLAKYPNHAFYGESFGWVQDLRYGARQGQTWLSFFDIFDVTSGRYLDWHKAMEIFNDLDLRCAPMLYSGPFEGVQQLEDLVNQNSTVCGAQNIMEGVVIRPQAEQWDPEIGRVILKYISSAYLLRHGGSEGK